MTEAIALIGLPGCGKSTYGKQLAKSLNRPFYDLDTCIELAEGMTVREIFEKQGEAYFRAIEWESFLELIKKPDVIIATGGGLVPHAFQEGLDKPQNVFFLYLNPALEVIVSRLSTSEAVAQRPLLADSDNLFQKMENLAKVRNKAYLAWADEVLCTF